MTVAVTCITRWYNVLGVWEVELCKSENPVVYDASKGSLSPLVVDGDCRLDG